MDQLSCCYACRHQNRSIFRDNAISMPFSSFFPPPSVSNLSLGLRIKMYSYMKDNEEGGKIAEKINKSLKSICNQKGSQTFKIKECLTK